jgi:hypothetical protein
VFAGAAGSVILEPGKRSLGSNGGRSTGAGKRGGIVTRYVPGGADIQVGVTTFAGRGHTEIARLITFDHGWKLYGDQLIDENEVVIADTLEELAETRQ